MRRERRCRACGLSGFHSRAHIVPRGQRGDDVPENMLPLCGSGNTGCHGVFDGQSARASYPSLNVGMEREDFVRTIWLRIEEIEYVLGKKGEDWLRHRFAMRPMTP